MFRPSRMFSWYQSFTISAQWKKGKKIPPSDSKVVLTNMKMISNEKNLSKGLRQYPPTTPDSSEEPGLPESSTLLEHQANSVIISNTPVKTECLATLSGLNNLTMKCQIPRLAKFESEDSGVELPNGANSLSTHKGSGQSFVLHSRDSSCDSGVLSASSSPAADHLIMRMHKDTVDAGLCISCCKKSVQHYAGQTSALQTSAVSSEEDADYQEGKNPEQSFFGGRQEKCLEDKTSDMVNTSLISTTAAEEKSPRNDYRNDNLEEMPLQGHPLRKYPTSDSLNEYMDECCRLSKVNQGNAKAHSSGLGYLEHICQLIEKIGQLQEHNLRLQKEICSLQKEQKTHQLNEQKIH